MLFPFNKKDCTVIHSLEIIRSKEQPILKVSAEPFHILNDGLYKLCLLFCRICIVKTQVEFTIILFCQSGIQNNGLGMSNMKISVGFRWESGLDMTINALCQIFIYLSPR